jgi:hypothetical protein
MVSSVRVEAGIGCCFDDSLWASNGKSGEVGYCGIVYQLSALSEQVTEVEYAAAE